MKNLILTFSLFLYSTLSFAHIGAHEVGMLLNATHSHTGSDLMLGIVLLGVIFSVVVLAKVKNK